jgi:hypothetical protein
MRVAGGLILVTLCLTPMGPGACSTNTTACTTDADCFNGQACVQKTCQPEGAECGSDADCPTGKICDVAASHTCLTASGLTCAQVGTSEGWGAEVCESIAPDCQGIGVTTADCNHCCQCLLDTDCKPGYACLLDTHTCTQLSTLTCAEYGAHQGWGSAICQRSGESQCGDTGDATSNCDHCCECQGNADCQVGTVCVPTNHLCSDALELTCDELAVASGWDTHACQLPGMSPACSSEGRATVDCTFCCCTGAECQ